MAIGDGSSWNESVPTNATVANQIDDYNRDLRTGISARMRHEHIWPTSQTGTDEAGYHTFITFQATASPTLAGTTAGALFVGQSSAGYPLVFKDSSGDSTTLVSSDGNMAVISGGSQGGIVIASSASPTGVEVLPAATTDNYVLTSKTTTGSPKWTDVDAIATTYVSTAYDSGWFATSKSAQYTKTHGLGTTALMVKTFWASDTAGSDMHVNEGIYGAGGFYRGAVVSNINSTNYTLYTGQFSVRGYLSASGVAMGSESGYSRIVIIAIST